ncbi:MAG TPA: glycosyl hydrolase family 28 protein [Bryobacteraceae bacterium]
MKLLLLSCLLVASLCAQDTRHVTEPSLPPACTTLTAQLSVTSNKVAPSDESKLDTERIQKAMDACGQGKSVVLKTSGSDNAFLTGPLQLRAGVTLVVDSGATLFGSRDPRLYDITPGVCGTITQKGHGCRAMINGDGVSGAGVMGDGTIDGRGGAKIMGQDISWWDLAEQARKGGNQNNPRILILNHCDDFTLYRITLKDSPNFHVSYSGGRGFTAWGVKVNCPRNARNTDAIDPGNARDVTITHCFIHTGDDNVAIKAGAPGPTTQMTIAHNHFYTGHGMSIGSETNGGASKILVTDLTIDGADNGIRIKSNSHKGGLVHDIVYEDVCIRDTRNPIYMDSDYEHGGRDGKLLPQFNDIVLRDVHIFGGGKLTLDGYDPTHKLGMLFDDVTIADLDKVKVNSQFANLTLNGGSTDFHATGEEVHEAIGGGAPKADSCQEKFVPYPGTVSVKE